MPDAKVAKFNPPKPSATPIGGKADAEAFEPDDSQLPRFGGSQGSGSVISKLESLRRPNTGVYGN